MEPTATMSASPAPAVEREPAAVRARRLAAARRRATALLAGVAALFIAVTAAGVHGTFLGYVQAGAEAALVGGVADWFAVTALFRRPLGLPIPHTALIVERKDQFAATLGQFVQENFLNADVLADRIRSASLVPRLATWLADEANAARFAGHAADLAVTVTETLRDEDVQRVLTAELTRAVDAVELAPLAGRAMRVVIAGGHHAELFNAIVSGADRYLGGHYLELRQLFAGESPRWVPEAVYRRVFDRLYTRLRQRLAAMAADPGDEARRQFEAWIAGLPDRLETSPELRERGERLKRDVLGSAGLRDWSSSLWQKAKDTLRTQAADPESELRRRLADALAVAGRRLGSDRRLQESLERVVESGARALADQFHDELADLVTGTIERWDAAETSSQLELLLGRDLQFIRINGTVVGAGVGLALHAIVLALALSAFLVMDGGEQRGVRADQRGALPGEQRAVGPAAFPDPLIGQIHRLHAVHGGWPERGLGLAVEVAVQAGHRFDQLVAGFRGIGRMLALAVRPPPVDLQDGRSRRVRGLAVAEPDQLVKLAHAGPGPVRVVVGERRPQLGGAQHQPGALQGPGPVRAEAELEQPDHGRQHLGPAAPVVGHPHPVFQVGDAERVERPGHGRRSHACPPNVHGPPPSSS